MNHLQTALDIITQVGGAENIEHIEHCSTRLRLSLYDNGKVNEAALAKIDGVLGVRVNVQCQVIIGHEVVQVFEAVRSLAGEPQANAPQVTTRPSRGAQVVDFVISVFQPLVPAIAGGGVLKSLLLLLDVLGWLSRDSSTYKVLDNIGSAPLYFLPILVAITTATKLKVNVLVAVSAVAVMRSCCCWTYWAGSAATAPPTRCLIISARPRSVSCPSWWRSPPRPN
ncbi:PTS system beta-glucoside-specific EIIBCA component [compost metagenome]